MDSDTSSCLLSFLRRRYYKKKKKNNIYNVETGSIITQIIDDSKDTRTYVKYDRYRPSVNEDQLQLNFPEIMDYKRTRRRRPSMLERSLSKNNQIDEPPQFINDLEETSKKIESSFPKCTVLAPEVDYEKIREAVIPILKDTDGLKPLPKRKVKRDLEMKDICSTNTVLNDEEYEHIKLALKMMFSNVDQHLSSEDNEVPQMLAPNCSSKSYVRRESRCDAKLTSLVEDVLKSKSMNKEPVDEAIRRPQESIENSASTDYFQQQKELIPRTGSDASSYRIEFKFDEMNDITLNAEIERLEKEYEREMEERKLIKNETSTKEFCGNEKDNISWCDEVDNCHHVSNLDSMQMHNENDVVDDNANSEEFQTKTQFLDVPKNKRFQEPILNKTNSVRRSSVSSNVSTSSLIRSDFPSQELQISPKLSRSGHRPNIPSNRLRSSSPVNFLNETPEHSSSFTPYKKTPRWIKPELSSDFIPTSSNESASSDDSAIQNLSMIQKYNVQSQSHHSPVKNNHDTNDARRTVNRNPRQKLMQKLSGETDSSSTSTPPRRSRSRTRNLPKNENYIRASGTNAHGQVILEPEENLSDKEVYPDQSVSYNDIRLRKNFLKLNHCEEEYLRKVPNERMRDISPRSRSRDHTRRHQEKRDRPSRSTVTNERIQERLRPDRRGTPSQRGNSRPSRGKVGSILNQKSNEPNQELRMSKTTDKDEIMNSNEQSFRDLKLDSETGRRVIAILDSPSGEAIQFAAGQIVHVKGEPDDQGFCLVEVDGVHGLVPITYLKVIPDDVDWQSPKKDVKATYKNETIGLKDNIEEKTCPPSSETDILVQDDSSSSIVEPPIDNPSMFSMGNIFMKFGLKKWQKNNETQPK